MARWCQAPATCRFDIVCWKSNVHKVARSDRGSKSNLIFQIRRSQRRKRAECATASEVLPLDGRQSGESRSEPRPRHDGLTQPTVETLKMAPGSPSDCNSRIGSHLWHAFLPSGNPGRDIQLASGLRSDLPFKGRNPPCSALSLEDPSAPHRTR